MRDDLEESTFRKIFWRLVPLLFLAMVLNLFDRFNIGFAALRMNHDIGLHPAVFGAGTSLFYSGYILLGVPSNFFLHRFGAQKWLSCIVILWGLVAILTAFVWDGRSFLAARFLLGLAEAGFLPGAALYASYWFPVKYRARAIGSYLIGGQVALVIGAPISASIMTWMDGDLGLHGWQWMFILEALPAVLLGLVFLLTLTSRPANARWLPEAQRDWLQQRLAQERAELEHGRPFSLSAIVTDPRVWSLAFMFGAVLVGVNSLNIWLPQIINGFGHLSLIQVGLLSALPNLMSILGILIISYTSDRTGDRKYHLVCLYAVAGLSLAASAYAPNHVLAYIMLCITGLTINSGTPLFWSLNSSMMTGAAAAGSIAFVNTVSQGGGIIGPFMAGYIRGVTGNFALALVSMGGFMLLASLIAFTMRVKAVPREASGAD